MNSPVKLWIEALLSGKYKQIQSKLKTDKGHCCLGVLCEVYNENNADKLIITREEDLSCYKFDESQSYLPPKVLKWLRISMNMPALELCIFTNGLTTKNDSGMTFAEIVPHIRKFFKED